MSAQAVGEQTCSFFHSLLHRTFILHSHFSPFFSRFFFVSMPSSLSVATPVRVEEPTPVIADIGNDADNDMGDDADDDADDMSASHMSQPRHVSYPSSAITCASSQSLKTQLSQPSGLPIDSIARLTHDELRHNAEFIKYVDLVDHLQELLAIRNTKTKCAFISFSGGFFSDFFVCFSPQRPWSPTSLVPRSRPCAQATRLRRSCLTSNHCRPCLATATRRCPSLTLVRLSALRPFHPLFFGPSRTARTTPMPASPAGTSPDPPCGARSGTKTGA